MLTVPKDDNAFVVVASAVRSFVPNATEEDAMVPRLSNEADGCNPGTPSLSRELKTTSSQIFCAITFKSFEDVPPSIFFVHLLVFRSPFFAGKAGGMSPIATLLPLHF